MKGENDPPLKPDSEYPEWLWKLLDPAPTASELQKRYESSESREGLTIQEVCK
jgi:large subunit ribosomal protein L54